VGQNAAGAFAAAADAVREGGVESLSADFQGSFLHALELVMLAQAQECFYLKAIMGA
jgi:hypothetical protein